MNPALWLLLAMVGVSLYATFDVRVSLGKVAGVALGVALFWALARWATTRARLTALACAFLLAGGALAAIGLAGTNWFEKFPVLAAVVARLPRIIRGVPGAEEGFHPNAVAGCLVLFVPLQVALLGAAWHREAAPAGARAAVRRTVLAAEVLLLLLTGGTLLLTQSRGAWLGTAIAAAAFLAWRGRPTRALVVAAVRRARHWAAFVGPGRLANLAISQSGPGMAENAAGRVELWSRAIEGIQDFPFTGMGMNAFRTVMPAIYPTFLTSPDFDVAHAHNHLLQAALDIGLPGPGRLRRDLAGGGAAPRPRAPPRRTAVGSLDGRRPGRGLHRPLRLQSDRRDSARSETRGAVLARARACGRAPRGGG